MRDELLAYLLGDLGLKERAQVEARIASDPIWQHELERLRSCLEAYEADSASETSPPENLAGRTCSFVKKAALCPTPPADEPTVVPASLTESRDPVASSVSRWSWADITVGGGIVLVLVLLAMPALQQSREAARRLACQNNLRGLGSALAAYAERFGGNLPEIKPNENTGVFVIELADRGVLTREELVDLLVCPSTQLADDVFSGKVVLRVPTREELASTPKSILQQYREHMSGSFAYRVGYVNSAGEYRNIKFTGSGNAPLLADAPSFSVPGFQSGNHGGCGQNVLHQDLSTRYNRQCVGKRCEDHMYLNANDEQAAGLHASDVVLMRSEMVPVQSRGR